jgi:hypothetical protein
MPYGTSIAEARKAEEIRRLRREIESLEAELSRSRFGADGTQAAHLADKRVALLKQVNEREDEIARLGNLGPDQLVTELVPEVERARVAEKAERPPTWDEALLGRGAKGYEQVVVSESPRPVRRIGPEPAGSWIHNGRTIPANVVLAYDADGNLVAA